MHEEDKCVSVAIDPSVYGGFADDAEADEQFRKELDAYMETVREQELPALEARAAEEDRERRELAASSVKSVFSEHALQMLTEGLYMSHMPTRLWKEPKVLSKILLSMYMYEGWPSVSALIDNMDQRGLGTRRWQARATRKRWAETAVAKPEQRSAVEPCREGFKQHFLQTDSAFREYYITMPKDSLPESMRLMARSRNAWLQEFLENNTFGRNTGPHLAVRLLDDFMGQFPKNAQVLVPWSQYLARYFCSRSHTENLRLLKITANLVSRSCTDEETLRRMPMSRKFRDSYFGASRFGNDERYWNTHHLEVWNTMMDCVAYALMAGTDQTDRVREWAAQMLNGSSLPKEAAELFLLESSVPMVCYTRPQSPVPPRTQIFAVYPMPAYCRLAALTIVNYFTEHKGSYSRKTPLGETIRKLLILPVKSVCVPERPEDLLLFGNLYSNLRLW